MNLRLFSYFFKPFKWLYAAVFVVMVISSSLDAMSLAALLPLLSAMTSDAGNVSRLQGLITMITARLPFADPILSAAVVLLSVFAAKAFFGLLREMLVAYASGKVLADTKNRLIENYSQSPYQFFLDNKTGNLIYRAVVAPTYVSTLTRRVPQMVAEALKGIAILTVLMMIFPLGVLVLAAVGLVYYQAIRHISQKVSYNVGRERADVRAEEHVVANELVTGIRQMIVFCTAGNWVQRFKKKNRRYIHLLTKDLIWLAVPKQLMEFSALALMLGLVFVMRYQASGDLSRVLPELGIFVAGLVQLLPTVTELGRTRMEVLGILPEVEAIHAAAQAPRLKPREGGRRFTTLDSAIVFKNVYFTHAGRETLLGDLNISFERGKVTALVGSSGAGKSTIVNLLLGLYEPSGGCIFIDGVPLGEYDLDSWRRAIGFVSQDPFVIHGTVEENIVFGRLGFSKDDAIAAARLANADPFIRELPEGYETVVGERGMKLSGGQQQRLCIARALLSNPPVLLLDEATSSLDSISERAIQETIRDISEDRTVIQIAHRASTVARADQIVVLHQGRIVEQGSHTSLLQNDGEYARLFATAGNE